MKHLIPILIVLALMGCQSVETEPQEDALPDSSKPDGVFLSAAQLEHAGIEFGEIQLRSLSSDVQARGELALPVNARTDMVSIYPGIVKAVNVNHGDPVKKGQVLAVIKSPAYIETQQEYLMVKSKIGMLQQEYERQKGLNKDKIASDKYFERSRAEYEAALAELNGLGLILEMAGADSKLFKNGEIDPALRILSPMDGYVESISINPGKYVNPDEYLMQVINREHLLVELSVFEKDILNVSPGQRLSFSLASMDREVHDAVLVSVGNIVDEETRTVKVLGEFTNSGSRLLPGMFVAGDIHCGEDYMEALPEEAVLRIGDDNYFAFYTTPGLVGDSGTIFRFLALERGLEEDGFVQVSLQGSIPADAMIVTRGGYSLKTELAKQNE